MKNLVRLLCLLLVLALVPMGAWADVDSGEGVAPVMPMRDLTAAEITAEMGTGWNLGNTMDGHSGFVPSETCWQPTVTTQKLITAVHDAGFNTMRLPVTWGEMIDDANGYRISEAWLSRVQDIADYAVSEGMYVIINLHHDGAEQTGWLRIAAEGEALETVKAKYAAVWQQIALRFRDYDEHIIFESMNEVCGDDPSRDGYLKDFRTIEMLNQLFVDTVRRTGGNNARRWLSVPARYTNIVNTLNPDYGFTLPTDSAGKLMLSVHDYDYSFGIQANMNATLWNQDKALALYKHMEALKAAYVDKGVPVVLGEYGAVNKINDGNRAYYYEAMNRMCVLCGIIPCAWDIGWYDRAQDPDYTFALFDRATGEELFPGVISAIMRGYRNPLPTNTRGNMLKITKPQNAATAPELPAFETVRFPQKQVFAASGQVLPIAPEALPADRTDSLVYASSNPGVAAVHNGMVYAKAPGSAQITARSQAGDASDTMIVVVRPAQVEKPITAINAPNSVATKDGFGLPLEVTLSPADHTDTLYFLSADPKVCTVNPLGKLVAVAPGETTVTLITATGLKKEIAVTVVGDKPAEPAEGIPVGIGLYYNDSVHGHYATETGETLGLNGDGTYTLTFDAAKHLSDKAKAAGVTDITGVGAVYLYDTTGKAGVLKSCDIHYDRIELNGAAMPLKEHDPKSALKANGKLDTNDPLNAWDGSVTDMVTAKDYVLTFPIDDAPMTISITFTISNFAYNE